MTTDYGTTWATTPHHRLDTDLEALPTRIAAPTPPRAELEDLDAVPTQIAYNHDAGDPNDEAKTTQVDIGHLEALGHHSDTHDAIVDDMAWGTSVPDEYVQTKFLDSDEVDAASPPHSSYVTPQCTPALASEPVTTTHELPRQPPPRRGRGRGVIIAGICAAVGVIFGTAVGLNANAGAEATTSRVPTHDARAATPIEPGATVPQAAAQPVVEAPAPAPAVVVQPPAAPADPLADARRALEDLDLAGAQEALTRARTRGADVSELGHLTSQLAVLRGDGALAIREVRSFCESHGSAADWVALGRLLVQSEQDREAAEAFAEALALEEDHAEAHLGLVGVRARGAELSGARAHLTAATDSIGPDEGAEPYLAARRHVAASLVALENGEVGLALREANLARSLDRRSSEAALLLARIAEQRGHDPESHLRDAIRGDAPAPMALGMLAPHVEHDEACELASRYLDRAPDGFDARAMQRVGRSCERAL